MTATDTTMDATAAAWRAEGLSREILALADVVILGTIMTVLDGRVRVHISTSEAVDTL
jgi:hypothetical protein